MTPRFLGVGWLPERSLPVGCEGSAGEVQRFGCPERQAQGCLRRGLSRRSVVYLNPHPECARTPNVRGIAQKLPNKSSPALQWSARCVRSRRPIRNAEGRLIQGGGIELRPARLRGREYWPRASLGVHHRCERVRSNRLLPVHAFDLAEPQLVPLRRKLRLPKTRQRHPSIQDLPGEVHLSYALRRCRGSPIGAQ